VRAEINWDRQGRTDVVASIFVKLTIIHHVFLDALRTELYRNWKKNLENTVHIALTLARKKWPSLQQLWRNSVTWGHSNLISPTSVYTWNTGAQFHLRPQAKCEWHCTITTKLALPSTHFKTNSRAIFHEQLTKVCLVCRMSEGLVIEPETG